MSNDHAGAVEALEIAVPSMDHDDCRGSHTIALNTARKALAMGEA